ncbi:hypothetical protein [Pantoea sp. SoEX]|uniref:hypothetical protein n=1 Tax=Pantoea sp. SoEX TaxID=2576763 RepID=UPI00135A1BF3|nr:hypothetical protein [Pantoea sp. SoEX]MXP50902.1 hypothetical protein [Pantoea sp. SoEX]
MKIGDYISITCEGNHIKKGNIIAIETFNNKIMYLIMLERYPIGVWFYETELRCSSGFIKAI